MSNGIATNKTTTTVTVKPTPNLVQRERFDGMEMHQNAEMAARGVAERARALVEARCIMALKRPRDMDVVRDKLLKDCERPAFAEVARYEKPVGSDTVSGWTIRFAEAVVRAYTNVDVSKEVLVDDDTRRIVRVSVRDLESNVELSNEVTIEKTVERRSGKGRLVLGVRDNSYGGQTFIVEATEEEFATKAANILSRVERQLTLKFLPGDIDAECEARVYKTLNDKTAKDPEAEKKKILDGFSSIGVRPDEIAKYLGHPVAQCVPAEIQRLRKTFAAIRDGETTWAAVMDARDDEKATPAGQTAATDTFLAQIKAQAAELEAASKADPEAFARIVGRPFSALDMAADITAAHAAWMLAKEAAQPAAAEKVETPAPEARALEAASKATEALPADGEEPVSAQDLMAAFREAKKHDDAAAKGIWTRNGDLAKASHAVRVQALRDLRAIGGVS